MQSIRAVQSARGIAVKLDPSNLLTTDDQLRTHCGRHALGYLGMWTQASQARSAHIEALDPTVVRQCLLRLPPSLDVVSVPRPALVGEEPWPWPVLEKGHQSDVALYPLSLEVGAARPTAPTVIGLFRNTLSYRKLLYPEEPTLALGSVKRTLARDGYIIQRVVGIYPPQFIFWHTLSTFAGASASALHFRLGDAAFRALSTSSRWARHLCHLVVFYARR
jgi:hypothetical protein